METKVITAEMREKLTHPLPVEAVTPHPTKKFLSSIKSIYVTERLNDVFGTGTWKVETNFVDKDNKMVVVKVKFSIPSYGIEYECFGGNDNPDLGDAYKGATTDALTKIASWMGIGGEVFRGEVGKAPAKPVASKPSSTPPQRKKLTIDTLMDEEYLKGLCKWLRSKAEGKRLEDVIVAYYDCDEEVVRCITNEYLRINV
jgi:hypothetical protein